MSAHIISILFRQTGTMDFHRPFFMQSAMAFLLYDQFFVDDFLIWLHIVSNL